MTNQPKSNLLISLGIIVTSFALAYIPLPEQKSTMTIVGGTELKEPLEELVRKFFQENSQVNIELAFQGSQDIANSFIKKQNSLQQGFNPTIIIPANGEILREHEEKFIDVPQAIAKTVLVAVAWQERGKILFPNNKFSWAKITESMELENWSKIDSQLDWGSFNFVMTNPTRSNSGQLTLDLWIESSKNNLNNPQTKSLISLIKDSVYQPPRSTDILLQEFITRGANDGDVATVYESIALYRWSQATKTQGKPYQIYYPNPTIETVATAAILKQNSDRHTSQAAKKFIHYITQPQQQAVFVRYGFRPVISNLDLSSVPNSPWSQDIPGIMPDLNVDIKPLPTTQEITKIQELWQE